METLWKVSQRNVLCDKKKLFLKARKKKFLKITKNFQVSIKEKENNWL